MKQQDIELDRPKIPKPSVDRRKTLNAAPVQSPVVHKSKMDEGTRREARNFMKKQREKRKMEVKKEADKSFVIKQRLEELRQHTKDVLAKKKTKSPVRSAPPPVGSSYYSLSNHKMREIKELKLKPMKKPHADDVPEEINNKIESNIPKSPVKQPQVSVSPVKLSPVPFTRQSSTRPSSSNKKSDNNNDLRLTVPDVKLSMVNKQVLNRSDVAVTANTIPSWLQTSIIQPYPYNFIWAVRKKLEAFTSEKNVKTHMQHDFETPQIKRNKKSAKARRLDQIVNDEDESETNARSEEIELASEANTISEISSIRSDVAAETKTSMKNEPTINESIFHTVSDGKFIGQKRESVNSEFDRASFDKKLQQLGPENVSPNTTAKKMNFLSSTLKTNQTTTTKSDQEGMFKQPHTISTKSALNDLDNNNKVNEDKEEEFKKMLLAFNKSLSHVVEVNHLLSAALVSKSSSASVKSSSQKSPIESQMRDSEHDNRDYSSSFEKNIESSEKTSNISEMIENMIQADTKQQQRAGDNSEDNSSIQTLIADSDDKAIEDPPILYHSEQPQELTSSTTKITITRTDNNLQELTRKNGHETTLNESRLISMFRLSESELSIVETAGDQHDGSNVSIVLNIF